MVAELEYRHCSCCVDAIGLAHGRRIGRSDWKTRFWAGLESRSRLRSALDLDRQADLALELHRIAQCPAGVVVSGKAGKKEEFNDDGVCDKQVRCMAAGASGLEWRCQ